MNTKCFNNYLKKRLSKKEIAQIRKKAKQELKALAPSDTSQRPT